jgi:tetratricopeptide (TPR) repeat protein
LADIFKALNDKDKAILCYQRILQFDPKNSIAAGSLKEFTNIPSLHVDVSGFQQKEIDAITSFNAGNQKFQNGNINAAITEYNKAIRLKPDYYKAYNNLGILYASALGNYTEAIRNFNKAIEIRPDYADAWLGRGTSRYNLHDYQGACEDWSKAKLLSNMQAAKMMGLYCK